MTEENKTRQTAEMASAVKSGQRADTGSARHGNRLGHVTAHPTFDSPEVPFEEVSAGIDLAATTLRHAQGDCPCLTAWCRQIKVKSRILSTHKSFRRSNGRFDAFGAGLRACVCRLSCFSPICARE